jgi:hypothetical protein
MNKFKFYLQRVARYSPRFKMVTKNVIIEADDLVLARQALYAQHPNWDVSMFWPV